MSRITFEQAGKMVGEQHQPEGRSRLGEQEALSRQVQGSRLEPNKIAESKVTETANEAAKKAEQHLPKVQITDDKAPKGNQYEVKPGDSFYRIARTTLGKDASERDVAKTAAEIAKINHMTFATVIHPGDKLTLPAHKKVEERTPEHKTPEKKTPEQKTPEQKTPEQKSPEQKKEEEAKKPDTVIGKTGETIETLKSGTVKSTWPDGTEKLERKDGSGIVKHPDGSIESWSQTKQNENFTRQVYSDGSYKVDYVNKTGFSVDKNGELQHWGPEAKDNYTAHVNKDNSIDFPANRYTKGKLEADGTYKTSTTDNKDVEVGPYGTLTITDKTNPKKSFKQDNDDDGTSIRTLADGSVLTLYANGSFRRDNPDGTGHTIDENGRLKSWGPKPQDNYQAPKVGEFQTDYADQESMKRVKREQAETLDPYVAEITEVASKLVRKK